MHAQPFVVHASVMALKDLTLYIKAVDDSKLPGPHLGKPQGPVRTAVTLGVMVHENLVDIMLPLTMRAHDGA